MAQTAVFPLDIMNITQGEGGSYSHQGRLAIDYVGTHEVYPYYAPCDLELINYLPSNAYMFWKNTQPVLCADGVTREVISIAAIHDCNPLYHVGDKISKGDLMGHTGICGNVTGDHVHFEVFEGTTYGQNELHQYDFWVVPESVTVINDNGYPWKSTTEDLPTLEIVCENNYLTREQQRGNAQYIANYFVNRDWTPEAIAGMLGNMERESTMSPCLWQSLISGNMSGGFGLVQWTPASILHDWAALNGADPSDITTQLQRIMYELDNGLQWIATAGYPYSFEEFTTKEDSPEDLASAFLKNYERAGVEKEEERRENARYWYDLLDWSGSGGGGGTDPQPPGELPSTDFLYLQMIRKTNMRRMGIRGRR